MINKPPPSKGLNSSNPIITPTRGRGFINQGSTLGQPWEVVLIGSQSVEHRTLVERFGNLKVCCRHSCRPVNFLVTNFGTELSFYGPTPPEPLAPRP